MPPAIIVAATAHFDAIVEIERASSSGSVVALAGAAALQQMNERGHWLAVAAADGGVVGWIWFSMEIDRGGETSGQVFRIAVKQDSRRKGVASALLAHARSVFVARQATRVRVTVAAGDDAARAFLGATGFLPTSLTMELPI